jgi:hypothetical protein
VKAAGSKGIILSAFINDAQIAMRRRVSIRDDTIHLPHLKGSGIPFIIKA